MQIERECIWDMEIKSLLKVFTEKIVSKQNGKTFFPRLLSRTDNIAAITS